MCGAKRRIPFYQWAATHFSPLSKPRWNFHKYLIAPDGKLVGWFSSVTSPTSEKVVSAIEEQLARGNRIAVGVHRAR